MHRKVRQYIEKFSLLRDDDRVVVALSGGADSVALLYVLVRLGYSVNAVHCNFHLRGEESVRDERFVKELCHKMGIELTVADFDTFGYAAEKKISVEMAARELRYDFFEKVRLGCGATAIAVAHHRDDVAETVLINLLRGTGIRGLHGIQPRNGAVVRPLLCVGRDDILEYLRSVGEVFVTDSTNLSNDYIRNKIRLDILPLMREINPSVTATLAESAARVAEAEKVYMRGIKEGIERVFSVGRIDIKLLLKEPSPLALLHEILSEYGFNGSQSEDVLNNINGGSGKEYSSATHTLTRDRDFLIISETEKVVSIDEELPTDGHIVTLYGDIYAATQIFDGNIEKNKNVAMLDVDKLKKPLRVRTVRRGDRFSPFGMRGSKAVSDYLTDIKKSLPEKRRQLVVVDADDKIVWLVGERIASQYAVSSHTYTIVRFKWKAK